MACNNCPHVSPQDICGGNKPPPNSANIDSTSSDSNCKPGTKTSTCTSKQCSDIYQKKMIRKLSKDELEDRYLNLCDDHLAMKKICNEQNDRIKRLATKLIRMSKVRKMNDCPSGRKSGFLMERIDDLSQKILDLQKENEQLKARIAYLLYVLLNSVKKGDGNHGSLTNELRQCTSSSVSSSLDSDEEDLCKRRKITLHPNNIIGARMELQNKYLLNNAEEGCEDINEEVTNVWPRCDKKHKDNQSQYGKGNYDPVDISSFSTDVKGSSSHSFIKKVDRHLASHMCKPHVNETQIYHAVNDTRGPETERHARHRHDKHNEENFEVSKHEEHADARLANEDYLHQAIAHESQFGQAAIDDSYSQEIEEDAHEHGSLTFNQDGPGFQSGSIESNAEEDDAFERELQEYGEKRKVLKHSSEGRTNMMENDPELAFLNGAPYGYDHTSEEESEVWTDLDEHDVDRKDNGDPKSDDDSNLDEDNKSFPSHLLPNAAAGKANDKLSQKEEKVFKRYPDEIEENANKIENLILTLKQKVSHMEQEYILYKHCYDNYQNVVSTSTNSLEINMEHIKLKRLIKQQDLEIDELRQYFDVALLVMKQFNGGLAKSHLYNEGLEKELDIERNMFQETFYALERNTAEITKTKKECSKDENPGSSKNEMISALNANLRGKLLEHNRLQRLYQTQATKISTLERTLEISKVREAGIIEYRKNLLKRIHEVQERCKKFKTTELSNLGEDTCVGEPSSNKERQLRKRIENNQNEITDSNSETSTHFCYIVEKKSTEEDLEYEEILNFNLYEELLEFKLNCCETLFQIEVDINKVYRTQKRIIEMALQTVQSSPELRNIAGNVLDVMSNVKDCGNVSIQMETDGKKFLNIFIDKQKPFELLIGTMPLLSQKSIESETEEYMTTCKTLAWNIVEIENSGVDSVHKFQVELNACNVFDNQDKDDKRHSPNIPLRENTFPTTLDIKEIRKSPFKAARCYYYIIGKHFDDNIQEDAKEITKENIREKVLMYCQDIFLQLSEIQNNLNKIYRKKVHYYKKNNTEFKSKDLNTSSNLLEKKELISKEDERYGNENFTAKINSSSNIIDYSEQMIKSTIDKEVMLTEEKIVLKRSVSYTVCNRDSATSKNKEEEGTVILKTKSDAGLASTAIQLPGSVQDEKTMLTKRTRFLNERNKDIDKLIDKSNSEYPEAKQVNVCFAHTRKDSSTNTEDSYFVESNVYSYLNTSMMPPEDSDNIGVDSIVKEDFEEDCNSSEQYSLFEYDSLFEFKYSDDDFSAESIVSNNINYEDESYNSPKQHHTFSKASNAEEDFSVESHVYNKDIIDEEDSQHMRNNACDSISSPQPIESIQTVFQIRRTKSQPSRLLHSIFKVKKNRSVSSIPLLEGFQDLNSIRLKRGISKKQSDSVPVDRAVIKSFINDYKALKSIDRRTSSIMSSAARRLQSSKNVIKINLPPRMLIYRNSKNIKRQYNEPSKLLELGSCHSETVTKTPSENQQRESSNEDDKTENKNQVFRKIKRERLSLPLITTKNSAEPKVAQKKKMLSALANVKNFNEIRKLGHHKDKSITAKSQEDTSALPQIELKINYDVSIEIVCITLNDVCEVFDPMTTLLYVGYNFLGYRGKELETTTALLKPRGLNEPLFFNFKSIFRMHPSRNRVQRERLRAILCNQDKSCVCFSVIRENITSSKENREGGEIGYGIIDFKNFAEEHNKNLVKVRLPMCSSKDYNQVIGNIRIVIDGVLLMKELQE